LAKIESIRDLARQPLDVSAEVRILSEKNGEPDYFLLAVRLSKWWALDSKPPTLIKTSSGSLHALMLLNQCALAHLQIYLALNMP